MHAKGARGTFFLLYWQIDLRVGSFGFGAVCRSDQHNTGCFLRVKGEMRELLLFLF